MINNIVSYLIKLLLPNKIEVEKYIVMKLLKSNNKII